MSCGAWRRRLGRFLCLGAFLTFHNLVINLFALGAVVSPLWSGANSVCALKPGPPCGLRAGSKISSCTVALP